MQDDYNPTDSLLIAEDIYLAFKEGGKAVGTTPHESAWIRLAIIMCYTSVFHTLIEKILKEKEVKEKMEKILKGNIHYIHRFIIEKALEKYKKDELIELYELRIKAEFILPPNYNVTLEDLDKAIKIASSIISYLKKE